MIRVGLVGEDPNDTSAIKNLLDQKYKDQVQFFPLAKGVRGDQLDSPKLKNSLPIEFEDKRCQFIIYIRDLDTFESNKTKLSKRKQWFLDLEAVISTGGLLLLNIWELEALILADMETFSKQYRVKCSFTGNPMQKSNPKELLKQLTYKGQKQYAESHCPELFKKLNLDRIQNNCGYFKKFIESFESKLKNLSQ